MIAEIYSAPRVTKAMKLMPSLELVPGFALDLSGDDEKGHAWDFTRADMREKAKALVLREKPYVLIGSPPCTAFSSWQHLNAARLGWTTQEIRRRRAEGENMYDSVVNCISSKRTQAAITSTNILLTPPHGNWRRCAGYCGSMVHAKW